MIDYVSIKDTIFAMDGVSCQTSVLTDKIKTLIKDINALRRVVTHNFIKIGLIV